MDDFSCPPLRASGITMVSRVENGAARLRISGNADAETSTALASFLDALHQELFRVQSRRVELDVRSLSFMNSSSLKALIAWIGRIAQLPPAAQYQTAFVVDPKLRWQSRMLAPIQAYAPSIVTVEERD